MVTPLFPVWPMPSTAQQIAATRPSPVTYPQSIIFDFIVGDFLTDGTGTPSLDDGHATWAAWCMKAIVTQRNAYIIYDSNYGTDLDAIDSGISRSDKELTITQVITSALLADPRTGDVKDFVFTWSGDSVTVQFTIVPMIGAGHIVTFKLGYGN